MATPLLEKEIEAKCCKTLQSYGCLAIKFRSQSSRAWPDRLVVPHHRAIFFIEFKRKGAKPTKHQELKHTELRERGHRVYVCDSVESLELILFEESILT